MRSSIAPGDEDILLCTTLRTVRWRLLPILFLMYVVAWIDRVNVGFAALQMNGDLHLGPAAYGFGAGVLAIGYALFEIPSTLVLYRVGARRWIARIMITWGIISAATMFVQGPLTLYVLRFLLGVAEAGFFPGMIFYLSSWFPAAERARTLSWFLAAIPLSSVVGGPAAGALLELNGRLGLRGWQWLFLVEGVPAIVLGLIVLVYLPDRPSDARWLSPDGASLLDRLLVRERTECHARHHINLRKALAHPAVWQLGVVYFAGSAASYGLSLWVPQILKGLSQLSDIKLGFLAALPYLAGTIATLMVGTHSDKTGERPLHAAACHTIGALGFLAIALAKSPVIAVIALTVAAVGTFGRNAPFWAMPSAFLAGDAAAGGIALINTLGALGGFSGPYIIGVVKGATGSVSGGLIVVGGLLILGAGLLVHLRRAPVLAAWTPTLAAKGVP